MKIYGNLYSDGLHPLASGKTAKDLDELKHGRGVYRSEYNKTLNPALFETLGASGSLSSAATKRYGLRNVKGRLFYMAEKIDGVEDALIEINPESLEQTTVAKPFSGNHWYGDVWRNIYISDSHSYDVVNEVKYTSAASPTNTFGVPFEWQGNYFIFVKHNPFIYNPSGHEWEQASVSDYFGGHNFFANNESVEHCVPHKGRLYMAIESRASEGFTQSDIYTFDGNKVESLNGPWVDNDQTDGPRGIVKLHGRLWVFDRKGSVYKINDDDTFSKAFEVPSSGQIQNQTITYIDDVALLATEYIEDRVNFYSSTTAIHMFDGTRLTEIGDWDGQFPGTFVEGMTILGGYLYVMGGVHLTAGTAFLSRIPISELVKNDTPTVHEYFESDQNISIAATKLRSTIEASGSALKQTNEAQQSFIVNASGDLYSNRARGWEPILISPFTTERRLYGLGVWHGEILILGTDEDKLWKVDLENKSLVQIADTMAAASTVQGKDSDGQSTIPEMFFSDTYIWDGDSKVAHGLTSPFQINKILGEIYSIHLNTATVNRWNKTSLNSWADVSADTVWTDISTNAMLHSVDCRGTAFLYTGDYSTSAKQIRTWNGNPDDTSVTVLSYNDSEIDRIGLMRYNDNIFVFSQGGSTAGRVSKYNWDTRSFDTFIADCGYNVYLTVSRNIAGQIYSGDFYFLGKRKADGADCLLKFDGWNVVEVDANLPTLEPQSDLLVYGGCLYFVTYDESGANQGKMYRWIKAPGQDFRANNERVDDIDTRLMIRETPPSGWSLPDASDWEYGDSYFHLGSGLYRRFVNPVGVPQWYQEVQHGRLAEVSEDNGLTGYTSLVLGAAGDWVPYVSNQASGSFKDCPGIDVTASGFTVNAGAAKCPISRGFWIVHSNVTFGGSNNTMFATSIFVNGNQQKNTTTHGKTLAGDHRISLHNQGVIHLADGDELTLRFVSRSASPTANIYSWNLLAHKYNPSS